MEDDNMTIIELFKNIKKAAQNIVGDNLWNYGNYNNCIDYWCSVCPEFHKYFDVLFKNEYEDFVLLRYNEEAAYDNGYETIDEFWDVYEGLYRECRSVVIDKKNECYVLRPFKKFFNMNQIEETSEENVRKMMDAAQSIEFSDKLDGSMQSARWYNGKLVMAGSQSLDKNQSYRLMYGLSMLNSNYIKMLKANEDKTFIFEFIHHTDVHVVKYPNDKQGLYLIGVREVESGNEWSYKQILEISKKYHIPTTEIFNTTLDEVLSSLDSKKSYEAEGFVINIDGYKIKLKYNDYVQIHKILKKIVSPNAIIRAIYDGTWDDLRSKIPESYKNDADITARYVFQYIKQKKTAVSTAVDDIKINFNLKNRKDVFLYANNKYPTIIHYIMCELYNKEYNFLRNAAGKFVKLKDIQRALE